MPGLPGAACSSLKDGLCASRHASACSRAPEPTTSTFTRASLLRVFDAEPVAGTFSSVQEPGIDEHEWVTEWEQIEPELRDSPTEAISEADDLVGRMMEARGFPLSEREGDEATEPETVREFEEAHRVRMQ